MIVNNPRVDAVVGEYWKSDTMPGVAEYVTSSSPDALDIYRFALKVLEAERSAREYVLTVVGFGRLERTVLTPVDCVKL